MSQHDAHLRTILDLLIPEPALRLCTPSTMFNVLGGTPGAHHALSNAALTVSGASVHLYGKGAGTPGRKMGHITVPASTMSEVSHLLSPLISLADQISSGQTSTPTVPSTAAQENQHPLIVVIMGSIPTFPLCNRVSPL